MGFPCGSAGKESTCNVGGLGSIPGLGRLFLLLSLLIIYLAVLDLCHCMWAFSSHVEWGLLSSCGPRASHCDSFSYCEAWALGKPAQQLQFTGSGAQTQLLGAWA